MKPTRIVGAALAVVAVCAAGVAAADAVGASRVEAEVSERIRPATPGVPAPSVMLGGGPTGRWAEDGVLAAVSVRAEGVERPGLGPVVVEASASDVAFTSGDPAPMTAATTTVSVLLTGETLGRALGLEDVVLGAADDSSLAGGTERRARVTGTLAGTDTRISAFVDLVVDKRGAHLVPVAAATGPAGVTDQDPHLATSRTALTLRPDVLPLGLDVERLTVRGGTVTASGTGGAGTPPLDRLVRADH